MVYNGGESTYEVSALVVDFGSHTTRAGYAGEDCPRVVCPSFYGYTEDASSSATGANGSNGDGMDVDEPSADGANGADGVKVEKKKSRKYYVGDDAVGVWRAGMEVDNFMQDGVVHDFEPASQLLHHILHDRLSVNPTEHPLMITEAAWNTPQSREKLAQLAFEGEGVPAIYFGSSGVLSSFSAGKPTSLVLDVGYANTSVVPVVDGYALRAGTKRQPLGSQLILSQLHSYFTKPTPTRSFPLALTPRQLVQKRVPTAEPGLEPKSVLRDDRIPHTSVSWRQWAENNLLETWREACGEVISTSRFDFSTARDLPQMLYEFPDGYCGNFGEERYRFNEILFDPKNYFDQSITPPSALRMLETGSHAHSLKDLVSLPQLVHDSIMSCDVDVRGALLQNIVVVGNTSLTRGLTERLDVELANLMPGQKIKIHSPSIPFERKYASWVGGSILASLGTFHQLWITKDEYEEHGPAIIHQRCK